jgi:hypothetical protein
MAKRSSAFQMLFGGGASRPDGDDDLRMSSRAIHKPLFRGGAVRPDGDDDLRYKRTDAQPLADGGEVDGPDLDVSDELVVAAEDVMDCLSGGAFYGDKPRDEDSKMERASKEASRRAKAKVLAQALKSFFLICESEPHDEG